VGRGLGELRQELVEVGIDGVARANMHVDGLKSTLELLA
jgi:hypothetical protein